MAASYGLNHFLPNYQEPRLAESMHSLTSQYHADFNSWSKTAAVADAAAAADTFTESVKSSLFNNNFAASLGRGSAAAAAASSAAGAMNGHHASSHGAAGSSGVPYSSYSSLASSFPSAAAYGQANSHNHHSASAAAAAVGFGGQGLLDSAAALQHQALQHQAAAASLSQCSFGDISNMACHSAPIYPWMATAGNVIILISESTFHSLPIYGETF